MSTRHYLRAIGGALLAATLAVAPLASQGDSGETEQLVLLDRITCVMSATD